MNPCSHPLVLRLIDLALEEDRVREDITCALTIDNNAKGEAEIFVREELLLCGAPLISQIFVRLGWEVELYDLKSDGTMLKPNEHICRLRSRYRYLLSAERTILNFLMRLCAIASATHAITSKYSSLEVCDTRKTTPGWRLLEKYAVRVGKGVNHRMNLADMILVKNNHIDARAGDLKALLTELMAKKPADIPVQVEVRNIDELRAAISFDPDFIMLDNFTESEAEQALKITRNCSLHSKIEISGGVTIERLDKLVSLGVKRVSLGALTHGAKSADIAMRVRSS